MKTNNPPDKDQVFPLDPHKQVCFLKNTVSNPRILVGDYTYYADFEHVDRFEKNVKYHFDFIGDRLIIGKFCMIASDVTFIMNGPIILPRVSAPILLPFLEKIGALPWKAKATPPKAIP